MPEPNNISLLSVAEDDKSPAYKRVLAYDALRYDSAIHHEESLAEDYAGRVIAIATPLLPTLDDMAKNKEVYDAMERAHITLAHNDFHHYLIALEWHRPVAQRFYQLREKTLRPIVDAITDMMVHDKYDKVIIQAPPRIGKSTLGLFALTWISGRRCDSPILATGYAEKITKMFHTGITEVYEDPDYNYHKIFPQIDLVHSSALDLTLDFRDDGKKNTRKYKSITCRAIDGALTGATEARQLLYIDDLVRDVEEALNLDRLATLNTKLISNVYSRRKDGCKELDIGTRWSIHDPLGMIERTNEDNPRVKLIRIPALNENDESNFDYGYGVGFSTEHYHEIRDMEDPVTWQAMYQQNPIEREGLLFPKDDLKFMYSLPDFETNPPDEVYAFCDVAFGGEDYLSLPIAAVWGNDAPVIIDVVFVNKLGYDRTEPLVDAALRRNRVTRVIFEANNGGDFYSRDIHEMLLSHDYRLALSAQRTLSTQNKANRIESYAPDIMKCSFMHASVASQMYNAFINQLTSYTSTGKNKHDDAADSMAGLCAMSRLVLNPKVTVTERRYL